MAERYEIPVVARGVSKQRAAVRPLHSSIPDMGTAPEYMPKIDCAPKSAEFLKWFGDSKVRDSDGAPLICFHGTSAASKKFANRGRGPFAQFGFWFAVERKEVHRFVYSQRSIQPLNIIPVYLCIKNPKEFHNNDELKAVAEGKFGPTPTAQFRKLRIDLLKEGFDGAVIRNTHSNDQSESWVAFKPSQIRSAIACE
jgi:hypothetical protein